MSVQRHYCMECGHAAREHEIAMNTPQRGLCLKCECRQLDSPSEEDAWNEIRRLRAALDKAKEGLEVARSGGGYIAGKYLAEIAEIEEGTE